MENEEIRQYLIDFVEKVLNECEAFTNVYGKEFVRKRLEKNLKKVHMNTSSDDFNTGLYNMENHSITIFASNNSEKSLTITDIENNKKLKHMILHESLHAIFRRTLEECQEFNIVDGTGILEFYKNNQELGRGLNEGLTEWICQKAGYGEQAYTAEKNIIKILELAIGEDAVMKLANGDVKGNVEQLLQMSKVECLQVISLVDNIYQNEQRTLRMEQTNLENEDIELDKSISHLEAILFEKYFKDEIVMAQKAESLSEETMQRLFELSFCVNGGKTQASDIFNSSMALKFKNEIYPQLLKRRQKEVISQRKHDRYSQYAEDNTELPVLYKKGWFQRLKESIKARFIKKSSKKDKFANKSQTIKKQQFKEYIRGMSNYLAEPNETSKTMKVEEQKLQKDTNELDLT